jgi:hypothetical protein
MSDLVKKLFRGEGGVEERNATGTGAYQSVNGLMLEAGLRIEELESKWAEQGKRIIRRDNQIARLKKIIEELEK